MKLRKLALGAAVTLGVMIAATATAGATSNVCKVEPVNPIPSIYETGKNFTFNNDGTVTAHFKVTGDSDCKRTMVFAVWKMPTADGQPLESQIFHDSAPKTATKFGPGVHKLTAKLPQCDYWQLDLLEGSDPKGFNGTANYGNLMWPVSPDNSNKPGHRRSMIDTMHGGQKKDCTPPKTDVCPNIDGQQSEVPAGHQKDASGNCVVPSGQGEAPVVAAAQTPENGKLPSTGPADIAATFAGVSTSAGVAHAIVRRFRRK